MEFSSAILSWNLRILKSMKRGLVRASPLKKNIKSEYFLKFLLFKGKLLFKFSGLQND